MVEIGRRRHFDSAYAYVQEFYDRHCGAGPARQYGWDTWVSVDPYTYVSKDNRFVVTADVDERGRSVRIIELANTAADLQHVNALRDRSKQAGRAKRRATGRNVSTRTRFEILKRDGFKCRYCGATADDSKLHVDHVVAVANGGSNSPANLITACADCNLGKAAVPLDECRLAAA